MCIRHRKVKRSGNLLYDVGRVVDAIDLTGYWIPVERSDNDTIGRAAPQRHMQTT